MDEMADSSDSITLAPTHSTTESPDTEIVARVTAGDENAFEELF
jgi:hypothetical protein